MLRQLILFGLIMCAVVATVHAQQVCRDTVIQASAPDSRYRANADQTVTDLTTGLIWKRCAEGLSGADCTIGTPSPLTWQQAIEHAASNAPWRLPNKKELASLVEQSCYTPSINSRFFPNTPSSWFWSSSPYIYGSYSAWYVYFGYGYVDNNFRKRHQAYVRLVRGGQ